MWTPQVTWYSSRRTSRHASQTRAWPKVGSSSWKKRLATTVHCHCSERARVSIPGWGVKGEGMEGKVGGGGGRGGGGGEGTVSSPLLPTEPQQFQSDSPPGRRVSVGQSLGARRRLSVVPPSFPALILPRYSVQCENDVTSLYTNVYNKHVAEEYLRLVTCSLYEFLNGVRFSLQSLESSLVDFGFEVTLQCIIVNEVPPVEKKISQ
ncbi:hypothetical protein E2C01_003531 [Portunus trituberculatus]|uniref:Uncharacterized protein n=1 Tax=Portunus trituberculatus TaxID=210409 RepID=A0A5B7CRC2_PORTR|nr:hypothetical protein [Portunus trituberculatus]